MSNQMEDDADAAEQENKLVNEVRLLSVGLRKWISSTIVSLAPNRNTRPGRLSRRNIHFSEHTLTDPCSKLTGKRTHHTFTTP